MSPADARPAARTSPRAAARTAVLAAALAAALGLTLATPPAAAANGHRGGHTLPATVDVTASATTPESVGWDPRRHRFVVGDVVQGRVLTVGLDGTTTVLADAPALSSVVGLRVDPARDRVVVTDLATDGSVSGVAAFHLGTGALQWRTDLAAVAADGAPHFTNDLALAPDGTAYVVDALSPVVYEVDVTGRASVLVRHPLLAPDGSLPGFQPTFGSDAAAWLPGGVLLVAQVDGSLLRVPLHAPDQVSEVEVDGLRRFVDSAVALRGGRLAVVTHGWFDGSTSTVQTLRSRDGWRTARVVSTVERPETLLTSLTVGPHGSTWVLDGQLDRLFSGQPTDGFALRRVTG